MHRFLLTLVALSPFAQTSYGMAEQKQQFVLSGKDKEYFTLCAATQQNAPIFDRLVEFYSSEKVLTEDFLMKAFCDAIDNCCKQQVRLLITRGEVYRTHVKKVLRNTIRLRNVKYITFFLENGFFDAKHESYCRKNLTMQEAAGINRVLFGGSNLYNCQDGVFLEQEPGRLLHELFCTNNFPTKEQAHDIISILKIYGADINAQDHNGNNVLLYFILRADNIFSEKKYDDYKASIITVLLNLGANPDICNNMGENPFMKILDKSDIQCYQPLIQKCIDLGANTDIIDDLSCKYGIQLLNGNTKKHIEKHWLTVKSMPAANIAAETIGELTESKAEEYAQGIIYEYLVGEQKKEKEESSQVK